MSDHHLSKDGILTYKSIEKNDFQTVQLSSQLLDLSSSYIDIPVKDRSNITSAA